MLLNQQHVDAVLLDARIPGQDGFGVCRAIKVCDTSRLTPVVLITGAGDSAQRLMGIEAGADDFVARPFHKEELAARLRSLVRMKRYTDDLENAEATVCAPAGSIEAKNPYTRGHCGRLA